MQESTLQLANLGLEYPVDQGLNSSQHWAVALLRLPAL